MTITNITFTTPVAGISQSTGQTLTNPTTAAVDQETFLVTGSLGPSSTGDSTTITVTKSLVKLQGATAQIRYGTSSTTTTARLNVTDSVIQIGGNGTTRVNNYFSLLRRGKIIGDTTQSGQKFVYTQGGGVAIIEDWDFIGIYCHEINGVFSSFKNVTYSGTAFNILNWTAGDLTLRGITLGATTNAGGFVAWLGAGNAANRFRFYDSSLPFTTTSIAVQGTLSGTTVNKLFRYWSVTERYQQGAAPVQDVLVIYRSDQTTPGTQAEVARYTTDASGQISGGRHDTLVQYSVDAGTTRAVAGIPEFATVRNYTVTTVANFREIRSYAHQIIGNNAYNLTAKVGDLDTGTYNVFFLSADPYVAGISKATALAYAATHATATATITGALTLAQLYASRKAYWRDTDGAVMGAVDGTTWDASSTAIAISSGGSLAQSGGIAALRSTASVTVASGGSITAPLVGVSFVNFANAGDLSASLSLTNSTQGLRITAAGTYDVSGWEFSGNTADVTIAATTGTVTVITGGRPGLIVNNLALGATFVRDDRVFATVSVSNLDAGSRLWVYNLTDSVELANEIVAGTSYSNSFEFTGTKSLKIRVMAPVGATAKYLYEAIGNFTSLGASFAAILDANSVYNSNGINGTTVTGVTWNPTSIDIDLVGVSEIGWKEIYASYVAVLTTEEGIRLFADLIAAPDEATYVFDTALVFNNLSATPVIIGGDAYGSRADDAYMGGTGNMQIYSGKAYLARSADVTAIKTKTDQLAFTGGAVNANVQKMNAADVIGTGTNGDSWRGLGVAP